MSETAREINSRKARERWADPTFRARMTALIKERSSRPEERAARSKAAIRQWADPEMRARQASGLRARFADPTHRARIAEVHKARRRAPVFRLMDRAWIGDGCWLTTLATNRGGYVVLSGPGRGAKGLLGHRVAYEAFVGPVPDGLELDHLCAVRGCVRPDHLEPVTRQENLRRQWERKKSGGRKA
jgi:hypothetical protein